MVTMRDADFTTSVLAKLDTASNYSSICLNLRCIAIFPVADSIGIGKNHACHPSGMASPFRLDQTLRLLPQRMTCEDLGHECHSVSVRLEFCAIIAYIGLFKETVNTRVVTKADRLGKVVIY